MKRRTLLLATAALVLSPPSAAQAGPAVSGQLIVGFEKDASRDRQNSVLSQVGARLVKRFRAVRGGRLTVVRPRSGVSTSTLRRLLNRSSAVAYAEPDFLLFQSALVPNDPLYGSQWALVNGLFDHDIDAPDAWGVRTSCAKVAIVDTGIDTNHPDLVGNIYKSSDVPNNNRDDDGNGYVDDTYGYDAIAGKGSGEDQNGHGTHVAGIIGARTNNGTGVAGTCWSASLVAVKFMNSRGQGSTSDAIDGLEYAVRKGAKIINCSFGSTSASEALKDAVSYAQDHGALLVVAAGNDGKNIDKSPEYPAALSYSNILSVAASTDQDTLASFSNYGSSAVDVAAPGDGILSTYMGGGYKVLDGTSMAAPYAAGIAALLKKQESGATYSDLRYALRHKVDLPPALNGKVAYDGRVNAQKALAAIGSLVD